MHVLFVNKDGSHINKSDMPLLSAFLDLKVAFFSWVKLMLQLTESATP